MGLFNKTKVVNKKSIELNRVLSKALDINKSTGIMIGLPENLISEDKEMLELVIFQVFELIKQLKEAKVFSKKEVHKFINENHKWVAKTSIEKLIGLGLYQLI